MAFALTAKTVEINPSVRKTVILLPQKCNYGLNYAAKELTWHIEKMTGVKLQTVRSIQSIPDGSFVISLGATDFAKAHGVSGAGMKHNHARVLGDENKLIITGNDRGENFAALLIETSATLFTVYHSIHQYSNTGFELQAYLCSMVTIHYVIMLFIILIYVIINSTT